MAREIKFLDDVLLSDGIYNFSGQFGLDYLFSFKELSVARSISANFADGNHTIAGSSLLDGSSGALNFGDGSTDVWLSGAGAWSDTQIDGGNGDHAILVDNVAQSGAQIKLGDGNSIIQLGTTIGDTSTTIEGGDGDFSIKAMDLKSVTLGDGNHLINVANAAFVTLGYGDSYVAFKTGAESLGSTISVGGGNDTVIASSGDDLIFGDDGGTRAEPADTTDTSTSWAFQVISLGFSGIEIDPNERGGNTTGFSENGGLLNGATFGSTGDPLSANVGQITAGTGNGSGSYDGDNSRINETFTINGVQHTYDGSAVYDNTVVTFQDGSAAVVSAVVFQDTAGNLFLAPESSNNADTSVYTSKPITSISLGTQNTSASMGNGMYASRVADSWVESSATEVGGPVGDDIIKGGDGKDIIYGDNGEILAVADAGFYGPRESFNWQQLTAAQADSSTSQDTGSVNVTYTVVSEAGAHGSAIDNGTNLNVAGIEGAKDGLDSNSSLNALGRYDGDTATYRWDFDEEVGNVAFNITDVDQNSVVTVWAYDAGGNQVPANFVIGAKMGQWENMFWSETGNQNPDSASTTAQVTIAGPVSRIEVEHEQHGGTNAGVFITDLHFDTGFQDASDGTNGEGGDDVIIGGLSGDHMFGEGGNDTFIISSAEEGTGDVIVGGNGPDQTADFDVLDLRAAGVVKIEDGVDASDAGARAGTVTFEDGSRLEFSQIEEILTQGNGEPVKGIEIEQQAFELVALPDPESPAGVELAALDMTGVKEKPEAGEEFDPASREDRLFEPTSDFFQRAEAYTQSFATDAFNDFYNTVRLNEFGDLSGTNNSDVIDDTSGVGEIFAMGGNDVINGLDGNDRIYAGDGDDVVRGGAGQDLLDGGAGTDILIGGDDIDIFVFRKGEGTTDIADFELSFDILDVEGFDNLTYETLTDAGSQVGADVFYHLGEDTLILRNVELETMIEIDLCVR